MISFHDLLKYIVGDKMSKGSITGSKPRVEQR